MTGWDSKILLAPIITGVLFAIAWTASIWAGLPVSTVVTARAEPQLIGAGHDVAPAGAAGYGVMVEVRGAAEGHPVRLDVWSDGGWRPEDEGTTDAQGRVRLESSDGAYSRVVTDVDGSREVVGVDPVTDGQPIYVGEEFDAETLSAEWLMVPQPDDGGTCTFSDRRAMTLADGQLALSVEEAPRRPCRRTGQRARLNGHVVFRAPVTYGTTAARIKLPRSRGVTSQFWLQPAGPGERWVMDAEHEGVVITETAGTDSTPRVATTVNRVAGGTVQSLRRLASPVDAPNDGKFHVYSVVWTPEGYTFQVDGRTIRHVESPIPVAPMFIGLATLSTQDRLPVDQDDRTMYVDWVRVWL